MKNQGTILIVDDNEEILFSLEIFLEKHFHKVITLKNPARIPAVLSADAPDVVILDMNFTASVKSGNEGLYWLKQILTTNPNISVVFITAYPGIELAVKAMKEGAVDFVEKPWVNEKMLATITNAYRLSISKAEIGKLKEKQKSINKISHEFKLIKGPSPIMQKIYSTIERVAPTDANILVLGENGSGKEYFAREIHRLSKRNSGTFIKVDIGALPGSLFESELFGHEKGAFTDAHQSKPGRIELAAEGTLFLDEIGNLSLQLQSKLLSVLQEKQFSRLGSNDLEKIDFRLISATNQPLFEMIENGIFREDLLYRINTVQIEIPPLRNRKTDIPVFFTYFFERYQKKYKCPGLKVDKQVIDLIQAYSWPGNIRQLDHAVEQAVIMAEGDFISADNFKLLSADSELRSKKESLDLYHNEKQVVESALKKSQGNLSKAADLLGIARTTLYRKLKKYDL